MTAVATTPPDQWRLGGRGGRQRLIPDAVTGELVPYQRTSTFSKTLDDKEGLIPWKAWMCLRGAEKDQALRQQALHAKATPRGVIDALAELGGAGEKRDKGSDRHQILAMALSGATLPQMPAEAMVELDALLRLVESLGTPVAVEAANVCDEWRVAGSCDLILQAADGATVVVDFKTGARIDRLSASIQLIAYARARYWDYATESRGGLVAPEKPRLVVLHAPQGGGEPHAIDLDVAAAKKWAELAAQVRDARKEAARKVAS
jgi:PD-(D/E)XK nuclease superfamily